MTDHMIHQLEVVGATATLYVSGTLAYEHVGKLIELCGAMPSRVRTLRVDLHGLGQLSADATGAVRMLLQHWRESRNGEYRLSTSHMVATLREVTEATPSPAMWSVPRVNDALTATYL